MAEGSKAKYTGRQKRKAEHIEESYEERGVPKKEAEERAWRTVNKQDHGGKLPGGSGRGKKSSKTSAKKAASKKSSGSGKLASSRKK